MRWIGRAVASLIVLALVLATALVWLDALVTPIAPPASALIARGQSYQAKIRRDTFGVPHILGRRDRDAAFGLAVAQSEDDFTTLQDVVLATRGVAARFAGPSAAVTDYLVALLDVWRTVDDHYGQLPADVRVMLEAYADGVNLYAASHPSEVKRGLLPVTGKDILAGFVFKQPFFYGLDGELKRLTETSEVKAPPKGSNALAVAPSRSADGATRLLINSHQPYDGPVAWYEAVVESGEGWHVAGGFFPGAPFMLHGHNATLGWANTVSKPDLFDAYRLTLNPKNRFQYRLDGQWRDFERRTIFLRVKIWGPLVVPIPRTILRAAHGPVLETPNGVFAFRYAGMGEYRQPVQYWRLNKARTMAEWQAGLAIHALPSLNYVYADAAGNIGFVHNGQYPDRRVDANWKGILPGDRSDLIWHGYRPLAQTPQIWNPPSGYVFNSNNMPFRATDPADDLQREAFPASMGLQTNMTNRAQRIGELVGADRAITDESFRRYKFDLSYSRNSRAAAIIYDLATMNPGVNRDLRQAQVILRAWDLRSNVDNRSAALANLTLQPILYAGLEGKPGPKPSDALKAAIQTLKTNFGRLDPTWGQVNRIQRGRVDLPIDGAADTYRAVWGQPQPDGRLRAVAGDTLIMFVTWDKGGVLSSDSIHQFGSATSHPESRHYADQTPLFAAMKTKPVWFTEAALSGHIDEDYRPGVRRKPKTP